MLSAGQQVILGAYAVASMATLGLYGWDKYQAVHQGRRIPERTLHLLELLGGWPGGLVGQFLFRHKLSKGRYLLVFWSIVVIHALGWILWRRR